MKMKAVTALCVFFLFCCRVHANNITTANVKLVGQNTTTHTTQVQFDISWENSWRTTSGPGNWDAAWVFVKYRVNSVGPWQHAYLNLAGHVAATGSTIDVGLLTPGTGFNATTNPGMGAFIYRDANGSGTLSLTGVQLQWNYSANGVPDNALVDVQVYGIEQVYVPAGSFYLGSGAGSGAAAEYGAFYKYPTDTNPFQVTSEAAITVGAGTNFLYYNTAVGGDGAGPIPAAFPKGYAAFYCMKYELSQQGYVDFLNSLVYNQAHLHYDYNSTIGVSRFAIDTISGNSRFYSRAPYIACNFLSWSDLSAYLDWAGLRPMTELEYEKACRGTLTPVPAEMAWGTPYITNNYYGITNRDANNEYISSAFNTNGSGNGAYYNTVAQLTTPTPGPLRVGIFASTAVGMPNPTRITVGATYYGIMEMTGNVYERPVTVGNTQGRLFAGTHGNGNLDDAGLATNTDWPAPGTGAGAGERGGSWHTPFNQQDSLSVSMRKVATLTSAARSPYVGGRGVRTAP